MKSLDAIVAAVVGVLFVALVGWWVVAYDPGWSDPQAEALSGPIPAGFTQDLDGGIPNYIGGPAIAPLDAGIDACSDVWCMPGYTPTLDDAGCPDGCVPADAGLIDAGPLTLFWIDADAGIWPPPDSIEFDSKGEVVFRIEHRKIIFPGDAGMDWRAREFAKWLKRELPAVCQ